MARRVIGTARCEPACCVAPPLAASPFRRVDA